MKEFGFVPSDKELLGPQFYNELRELSRKKELTLYEKLRLQSLQMILINLRKKALESFLN